MVSFTKVIKPSDGTKSESNLVSKNWVPITAGSSIVEQVAHIRQYGKYGWNTTKRDCCQMIVLRYSTVEAG